MLFRSPVPVELGILLAMFLVFGLLSHRSLDFIERRGRADGKLLTRAD